jgi:hypothetical protein
MKKFITIALLAIAFIMVAAPELNAGVSIGIGVGFPAVYGNPAYYPYGYGCYPYSYYGAPYYRPCSGLITGGTANAYFFGITISGIKHLARVANVVRSHFAAESALASA